MRHSADFDFLYVWWSCFRRWIIFFKLLPLVINFHGNARFYTDMYLSLYIFNAQNVRLLLTSLYSGFGSKKEKKAQIERTDFSRAKSFFKRRRFSFLSVYSARTSANYRTSRPAASIRGQWEVLYSCRWARIPRKVVSPWWCQEHTIATAANENSEGSLGRSIRVRGQRFAQV